MENEALDIIDTLFPFAVVLDADLRIVRLAAGWGRIACGPRRGDRFDESMTIVRPVVAPGRTGIREHLADIFVIRVKAQREFTLRGQFLVRSFADTGERLIFVGGPWVTELPQLAEIGLTLDDFPPHDARGDLLVLIQTQWATLEDMRLLTGRLRSTAESLEARNRELTHQIERASTLQTMNSELGEALEQLRRTKDQLIVQEKMASLGTLAAGIAHEIRNPLNFVNNFADLGVDLVEEVREVAAAVRAGAGKGSEESLAALLDDLELNARKIIEHGKRADAIVRQMLLHARGQSGEMTDVDVNRLLDDFVKLAYHGMRGQDSSFNVAIEKDYASGLPPVVCVPQDIGRVFLNVVNNGCYAADQKRRSGDAGDDFMPTIRVSSRLVAPDAVEVRVRDNGTGMSQQVRDRVFEPFFTTKPAGVGTGLGLSISYDIVVHQHGGRLEVTTEEGAGTEVTIVLPVSPRPVPA